MSSVRVLLAEDHPTMADYLTELLFQNFHVVGVVADGVTLVHAALALDPDIVVADISMPRLSGLQAVELLKKEQSRAKFVLLSVDPEEALAKRAFAAGASGFVVKMFAGTELAEAITAVLHGKAYMSAAVVRTDESAINRNDPRDSQ